MARRAQQQTSELIDRARTVAERFDALKAAHARAEADAALTRSQLGLALSEALAARAEMAGRLRAAALQAYVALRAGQVRRRRRNRLARLFDRGLLKLRSAGRALVIARSGLWPASGAGLAARWADFQAMAAYARRGPVGTAETPTLVDHDWYVASYPDVAGGVLSPVAHYIVAGGREGRAPSPLFDPQFYLEHSGQAVGATGLTPLEHFVLIGAHEGRDPHPAFSIAHYAAQRPELAESGENPLAHYLRVGWREGVRPHPLFDPEFYQAQLPRAERQAPPLVHYLTVGWRRGLRPHPLVDPAWYHASYADVAEAGHEPLTHFAFVGWREGRSPSGWFDTGHYVAARGEALPAGVNPLVDYLEGGAWRIGEARPGFPTTAYLAAHPQLAAEGQTPLEHWASLSVRR